MIKISQKVFLVVDPKQEVQAQPIQAEPKGNGEVYFQVCDFVHICILNRHF